MDMPEAKPALDLAAPYSYAQYDGVNTLFKYMSFPREEFVGRRDRNRRKYVEALLADGELYFPMPSELNDPFEASPHFKLPEMPPTELLELFTRDLKERHAQNVGLSEEEVAVLASSLAERITTGVFSSQIDQMAKTWRKAFQTNNPMCCLSATKASTVMWSYYAEGHTGVCVHIDSVRTAFQAAMRVNYVEEYPVLPLPLGHLDYKDTIARMFLTKSSAWKHEEEYRMINMPQDVRNPSKGIYDGIIDWKSRQIAILPAKHILGVTVGACMRPQEVARVRAACQRRQIKMEQAVPQTDRFELRFEPINLI